MRNPLPKNRLVLLTLAGATLTAAVAVGLAAPAFGIGVSGEDVTNAGPSSSGTAGGAAPTPNDSFTPAVQTQNYSEHEEHEGEEHEGGEYEGGEHEGGEGEYEGGEHEDYASGGAAARAPPSG